MTRNRRLFAFTLIEMMAVAAIIAVVAGVVVTRLMIQREGWRVRESIQKLDTVANQCRQLAVSTGKTYELSFDENSRQIMAREAGPDDGSDNPLGGADLTDILNEDDQSQSASAQKSLGDGWSLVEARDAQGETVDTLAIQFFPDGTSAAGTAQFSVGDLDVALEVSRLGAISVHRGSVAESTTQEWEAGDLEQRSN